MNIVLISIVGAILSLDARVFGRFLFSEPIYSSLIAYFIFGNIDACLIIGIFFQFIWIHRLPQGVVTPPDSCLASITSISLYSILKNKVNIPNESLIVLSIAAGIPIGYVSQWLEIHLKEIFVKFSNFVDIYSMKGNYKGVSIILMLSILISFLKSFAICFIFTSLGSTVLKILATNFPIALGMKLMFYLLVPFTLAVALDFFLIEESIKLFSLSVIIPILILVFFNISKLSTVLISLILLLLIISILKKLKFA